MALRGWCTSPPLMANPPFQSRQAQLESGVRGNVPAPFGAGERLRSPNYRYPSTLTAGARVYLLVSRWKGRSLARATTPMPRITAAP
jgi:hypothetical protein